jgi:16S rRNA (guanine527-N7)-methyltransferase
MERENRELLVKGASHFGIRLGERVVEAFDLYLRELVKWNEKMNLTAIRSEKGVVLKHFLDSMSVFPHLPKISFLLDIGSGAGFPGIPLKMIQPSLEVTLIDSVRKKVDFQRHIIRKLGLKGVFTIHGRVQDQEILKMMQGQFEAVISRAFADLKTLLPFALPFVQKGGFVLAMRGKRNGEEWQFHLPPDGIECRLLETATFTLPFSSIQRSILLFQRI